MKRKKGTFSFAAVFLSDHAYVGHVHGFLSKESDNKRSKQLFTSDKSIPNHGPERGLRWSIFMIAVNNRKATNFLMEFSSA